MIQLFQFDYQGKTYAAAIEADSEAEMREKLKAMAETARYDGVLVDTFDAADDDWEWGRAVAAKNGARIH